MPRPTPPNARLSPLSDDELDELADLLDDRSPLHIDGLLGLLHAVAVAPGLVPPSAWISLVFPEGLGGLDSSGVRRCLELVLRLHDDVLGALDDGEGFLPDSDDAVACESFAAGYAAGAELDPLWTDDRDRWTFASGVAYLAGRRDLVPEETLAKFDAMGDMKETTRRQLGAIVLAAHDSFREVRRAAPRRTRVARKAPCPCGSGKKYKRCCFDREHAGDPS